MKEETLNVSQLAKRFKLSRETVRNCIEAAGIQPVSRRSKETVYDLTEELEEALINEDAELDALKKRKLSAEAEEKEMKVAERKGELVPASEVKDAIQTIFSNLHREFVRTHKRIGARLAKAKTAQEATLILQTEDGKIFNRLRENYTEFLGKGDGA